MPNHVQNRLTIIGSDENVNEVVNHIKGKYDDGTEMQIDFNKIKEMPESLNIVSGSTGELAHRLLFGTKLQKYFPISNEESQKRFLAMDIEQQKEAVNLAIQYQDNMNKYGHSTWYDWACEHWGTKWNAYGQNDKRTEQNVIYFQTAWNSPLGLIQELSKMFPEVTIRIEYADEDSGSNTGDIVFQGGDGISVNQPESSSNEGYEIYFDLHPGSKDDYHLVDGKYQYKDEDEG